MSGDGWKHMRPDQPRTCARCGKAVKLSEGFFVTSDPPRTEHVGPCPKEEK